MSLETAREDRPDISDNSLSAALEGFRRVRNQNCRVVLADLHGRPVVLVMSRPRTQSTAGFPVLVAALVPKGMPFSRFYWITFHRARGAQSWFS